MSNSFRFGFNEEALKKYFKNTSWLLLARVGSLGIKMLVTAILIPNYLGGELTGALTYPLIFFFTGVATLGTDSLVTRQLLNHPEQEDTIMGSAFRIRLVGGLAAIPLIFATYFIINHYAHHNPAASFYQVAIMSLICVVQSTQIIDCYFQSKAEGKYIMFVQVGANILSALLKLYLVLIDAGINALVMMLVVDILLLQLGYIFFYKKQQRSIWNWKFDSKTAIDILKLGWPLALSSIFISLYMRIGQMMIDWFIGNRASGIYSTVLQYTESWYFIGVAICTALFPAIMNFRKNDSKLYHKRLSNLYDLLVLISVSIAILISVIAPYLYTFFYAGQRPEFLEAIPALKVNVWAGVFAFIGVASGQYLIAEGYTHISFLRTMIGAITIVILGLILVPTYGMIGAAYANLCAQIATTISILLFKRTRHQGLIILKSIFFISYFQFFLSKISK